MGNSLSASKEKRRGTDGSYSLVLTRQYVVVISDGDRDIILWSQNQSSDNRPRAMRYSLCRCCIRHFAFVAEAPSLEVLTAALRLIIIFFSYASHDATCKRTSFLGGGSLIPELASTLLQVTGEKKMILESDVLERGMATGNMQAESRMGFFQENQGSCI